MITSWMQSSFLFLENKRKTDQLIATKGMVCPKTAVCNRIFGTCGTDFLNKNNAIIDIRERLPCPVPEIP